MYRSSRLLRKAQSVYSHSRAYFGYRTVSSESQAKWTSNNRGMDVSRKNATSFDKQQESKTGSKALGLDTLQGLSLHAEPNTQRMVIDGSISPIGDMSFTVSGVRVRGSVLLLPHLATFWNVESIKEVIPDAFTILKLHHPRPDMLLLGTGAEVQRVSPQVYEFFRNIDVRFDVYDTKNACHVFNVLNGEGRHVAAALLPSVLHESTS